MNFHTFIDCGVLDNCNYAEAVQVILLRKKDNVCWNYFTHILFSPCFSAPYGSEFLTDSPISVNSEYKVIITKEVIAKQNVLDILKNAEESQTWKWKEDKALLDNVSPVDLQFIPETDSTGSKTSDSALVPIERGLYGSNYSGGYYLCELFSEKKVLSTLSEKDNKKIQEVINKAGLGFNLESLSDRIGNIVCKVPMKIIKHKKVRFTPKLGIAGQFTLNNDSVEPVECVLQIILENDATIIETRVQEMVFSKKGEVKEYSIAPNQYINRIILSDKKSGIIYYSAIRDYSFGSNYYSVISSPSYMEQSSQKRIIVIDSKIKEIELTRVSGIGKVSIAKEIREIEKRQHKWMTEYEYKHHFFRSFVSGQEKEAIQTVIDICNDTDLFWDLKEIWLIDPYLSAEDILKTVVYCGKYGISVKCLTNIACINNNKATRTEKTEKESEDKCRFQMTVAKYNDDLKKAFGNQIDLKLEFRTIAGMTVKSFHDRYLILKYGLNKSRAWSLGISVNSLGKSHHIIQIVQSPLDVIKTIEDIWEQSMGEDYLIYRSY